MIFIIILYCLFSFTVLLLLLGTYFLLHIIVNLSFSSFPFAVPLNPSLVMHAFLGQMGCVCVCVYVCVCVCVCVLSL